MCVPFDFASQLEYAFTNIHLLRNMNEKQRIAAVWHLVELGGMPLIVNALQPSHKAMSMGMTLMGMLFKGQTGTSHSSCVAHLLTRSYLFSLTHTFKHNPPPVVWPFLCIVPDENLLSHKLGRLILTNKKYARRTCCLLISSHANSPCSFLPFFLSPCIHRLEVGGGGLNKPPHAFFFSPAPPFACSLFLSPSFSTGFCLRLRQAW